MLNAVPSNAFEQLLRRAAALVDAGRAAEAAAPCEEAAALQPGSPAVLLLRGEIRQRVGDLSGAIAAFEAAAQASPGALFPQVRLAETCLAVRRHAEARAAARRALALAPDNVEALNVLSLAAMALNDPADAVEPLRKLLAKHPESVPMRSNLGLALTAVNRAEEAVPILEEAVALAPADTAALTNLGLALLHSHRYAGAMEACRRAVQLDRKLLMVFPNWVTAATAAGNWEDAIRTGVQGLRIDPHAADLHSGLLLSLHYDPSMDAAMLFAEHRAWNAAHAVQVAPLPAAPIDRTPHRPLRVGYVSPDFRRHSVAHFIVPLLEAHDRRRVEVVCFPTTPAEDDMTRRLRALPGGWRSIAGLSDADAAAAVRGERIDILVDLAGHTAGNRLPMFALRPAPIQVNYLGYPDTTGMDVIDYRLTDGVADPVGDDPGRHTERLVRLEGGFLCYAPAPDAPPPAELPALRNGFVTFGCFNTLGKLNGPLLREWAALLRAVPGSRLLLKSAGLSDEITRTRWRSTFEDLGMGPERVVLRGYETDPRQHLAAYHEVDIALDTFPYNGATTTCDALVMGVPVMTRCGDSHVSRVGASLLTTVGLTDWIAPSPETLVQLGAAKAADIAGLAELRRTMPQRIAPLTDGGRLARQVEDAYAAMWKTFLAGADR